MNEKEILLSHLRDLKTRAADNSMITFSGFLTAEERSSLSVIERENNKYVNQYCFGGYEDAERTVAVFVPKFYEISEIGEFFLKNNDESPLVLINFVKDKFTKMTHRDYLGALMSLGIKREVIGDIIVREDGAFVFCLKSMANYVSDNLKKAARGSLKAEILSVTDFKLTEDNGKIMFCSVASMRLDSVLSAAFSLSRKTAAESISKGLVFVNSTECLKPDYFLKEKDKLVIRGKGKAVINCVTGESKKGRIHLEVKRYK